MHARDILNTEAAFLSEKPRLGEKFAWAVLDREKPAANDCCIREKSELKVRLASGKLFPGQYFDQETGLNQNYNRDYNSKIGRYIESDPSGLDGGLNTFAYVANNPEKWIDPQGLDLVIPFEPEIVGPMSQFMKPGETLDPVITNQEQTQPESGQCPNGDPCKGLREQLKKHEQKLRDYIADPYAHDNLGFLGAGRDEAVIAGRIRSLKKQINDFKKQLEECEFKHGLRT